MKRRPTADRRLDARPRKQSKGPTRGYGLTDMALDERKVMDTFGLERVDVFGHSPGSTVAQKHGGQTPC